MTCRKQKQNKTSVEADVSWQNMANDELKCGKTSGRAHVLRNKYQDLHVAQQPDF